MKEAAGEANLTIITIVLIGIILTVGIPLINSALKGAAKRTCCQNAGGTWENNSCKNVTANWWDSANNKCVE